MIARNFKGYDLDFIHLDTKHLPKLRTADGECRKRYLFVAIDRRSRSAHLAVKDDETEASAVAVLKEALAALPFRVTRVPTDRGRRFTADGVERACRGAGVEHRKTKPSTPRTNGMVERLNGRARREVLGLAVAGHRDLERPPVGLNGAYNARRRCVLDGPLARGGGPPAARAGQDPRQPGLPYRPPSDSCILPKAMLLVGAANEVSPPDT